MNYDGECEICGNHDDHLWVHHFAQRVIVDGEALWRDVHFYWVCGECASNPPDGWRRWY